jgi:hypothetical protein
MAETRRGTIDLRERTFGDLTVVRRASDIWAVPVTWLAFCRCGGKIVALEEDLVKGKAVTCGSAANHS